MAVRLGFGKGLAPLSYVHAGSVCAPFANYNNNVLECDLALESTYHSILPIFMLQVSYIHSWIRSSEHSYET